MQTAKILPFFISLTRIASPAVWMIIVGLGYVNGVILYFFVKLDSKTQHHKLNVHHTIYLISLPSWIGVTQRFNPKSWSLRFYYFSTLLFGMAIFAIGLSQFGERAQARVRRYQVHTVAELVEMEYRLFGTAAVLENMRKQSAVSLLGAFRSLTTHLLLRFTRFVCIHFSIHKNHLTHFSYAVTSMNAWNI